MSITARRAFPAGKEAFSAPLCSEIDWHFESGRKDILADKTGAFRCYSGCACSGLFATFYSLLENLSSLRHSMIPIMGFRQCANQPEGGGCQPALRRNAFRTIRAVIAKELQL